MPHYLGRCRGRLRMNNVPALTVKLSALRKDLLF